MPKPSKAPEKAEAWTRRTARRPERFRQAPNSTRPEPAHREGSQDTSQRHKNASVAPSRSECPIQLALFVSFRTASNGIPAGSLRLNTMASLSSSTKAQKVSTKRSIRMTRRPSAAAPCRPLLSRRRAGARCSGEAVTPTTPTAPAQAPSECLRHQRQLRPPCCPEGRNATAPANVVTVPNVISTPIVNELIAENAELVFTQDNPKVKDRTHTLDTRCTAARPPQPLSLILAAGRQTLRAICGGDFARPKIRFGYSS